MTTFRASVTVPLFFAVASSAVAPNPQDATPRWLDKGKVEYSQSDARTACLGLLSSMNVFGAVTQMPPLNVLGAITQMSPLRHFDSVNFGLSSYMGSSDRLPDVLNGQQMSTPCIAESLSVQFSRGCLFGVPYASFLRRNPQPSDSASAAGPGRALPIMKPRREKPHGEK